MIGRREGESGEGERGERAERGERGRGGERGERGERGRNQRNTWLHNERAMHQRGRMGCPLGLSHQCHTLSN